MKRPLFQRDSGLLCMFVGAVSGFLMGLIWGLSRAGSFPLFEEPGDWGSPPLVGMLAMVIVVLVTVVMKAYYVGIGVLSGSIMGALIGAVTAFAGKAITKAVTRNG